MLPPNKTSITNRRILIVNDTKSIHNDFRKVLTGGANSALDDIDPLSFGEGSSNGFNEKISTEALKNLTLVRENEQGFDLDSAYQGEEAFEKVRQALAENKPYAMAFVDIHMPPGWDGMETLSHLWQLDANLQAVICTAHSDYSWDNIIALLGNPDRLLILKKPFEHIEVLQAANALVSKWNWRLQAEIKMEELEWRIEERTQKTSQQKKLLQQKLEELKETRVQLIQSEKLASVGQLAAGIAHEINNPVGFISSNLNTLQHYIADIKQVISSYRKLADLSATENKTLKNAVLEIAENEQKVGLEFVLKDIDGLLLDSIEGTQRVRKIVSDLSEFSHINSPDIVEVEINELLEKSISLAWNELKYKAEVVREFGDIPVIFCYGSELSQVFLNLLINAAQAIDEWGIITIKTGVNNKRVWITIQDNGNGIDEVHLTKIFDPFFTTKDVGEGTGLGLHIVRNVIDAHLGNIHVESTLGEGTSFHIDLPANHRPLHDNKGSENTQNMY